MEEKWTMKDTINIIRTIIILTVIMYFITTEVCHITQVQGESMYPNIKDKEILMLNCMNNKVNNIKRYDVVVFEAKNNNYYIKRVIGLPGETIKVSAYEDAIYINGKKLTTDIYHLEDDIEYGTISTIKLAKDEYFVLGDNRNISDDSRSIGPIKSSSIDGVIINKR